MEIKDDRPSHPSRLVHHHRHSRSKVCCNNNNLRHYPSLWLHPYHPSRDYRHRHRQGKTMNDDDSSSSSSSTHPPRTTVRTTMPMSTNMMHQTAATANVIEYGRLRVQMLLQHFQRRGRRRKGRCITDPDCHPMPHNNIMHNSNSTTPIIL